MLEYFFTRESLCLYWDSRGNAYGVLGRCKNAADKIDVIAVSESKAEGSLELNLKKVLETLNPDNRFYTVLGGSMANEIFIELKMPVLLNKENIRKALEFELPRQVPCSVDDIIWSYRISKTDSNTNSVVVRIWAILKKSWQDRQNEILKHDIKVDSFHMPFMCDFESGDGGLSEILFESIEKDYSLNIMPDGMMEMRPLRGGESSREKLREWLEARLNFSDSVKSGCPKINKDETWYPALVMLSDSLNKNFKEYKKQLPSLPVSMIPQRFREWKIACMILAAVSCLFLLILAGRSWYDAHSRLVEIREEKAKITQRIAKSKKENASSKEMDAAIKKIFEASSGNAELLKCIHFMTEAIPESMWMIEMNSNNDKIDLALKTSGEGDVDSINWAKSNNLLSLESIRKRRNNDASTDVFLKLVYHKDRSIPASDSDDKNKVAAK